MPQGRDGRDDIGSRDDIARLYLEKGAAALASAKKLMECDDCLGANNRIYYAIYYAISALHTLDGNVYRKHKGTLSGFQKDYIRTGIFPKEWSAVIQGAELLRLSSDYDPMFLIDREETQEQLEQAEKILPRIAEYCETRMTHD